MMRNARSYGAMKRGQAKEHIMRAIHQCGIISHISQPSLFNVQKERCWFAHHPTGRRSVRRCCGMRPPASGRSGRHVAAPGMPFPPANATGRRRCDNVITRNPAAGASRPWPVRLPGRRSADRGRGRRPPCVIRVGYATAGQRGVDGLSA